MARILEGACTEAVMRGRGDSHEKYAQYRPHGGPETKERGGGKKENLPSLLRGSSRGSGKSRGENMASMPLV